MIDVFGGRGCPINSYRRRRVRIENKSIGRVECNRARADIAVDVFRVNWSGQVRENAGRSIGQDGPTTGGSRELRPVHRNRGTRADRLRAIGDVAGGYGENAIGARSEERRVGKECRSRWSP